MISAKNSFLIFDQNYKKCFGAQRAPRNFNLGDHLLGLGTQTKMPGSPKGSLKFSLEHSLVLSQVIWVTIGAGERAVFYTVYVNNNRCIQ